jgi:DNA-binding transcriptional regulator GbsR (MarR family)
MKLTTLKIQNFEGVGNVALTFDKPVTVLAGGNGQGKSSICDAIRLAMTGATGRDVEKKADYQKLIKEGTKKALINVQLDTGDSCGIDILKTKSTGSHMSDNALLPYVLDASRFAKADSKERRTVLMKATGASVAPAKVKEMLSAQGCDMEKAEQAIPLLRSGFPAAESHCRDQAREAKADWKAVTGETWGSDKGEVWEPERVEFDAGAMETLKQQHLTASERFGKLNKELGELQGRQQQQANIKERTKQLEENAALLDRRQKALEAAQQQLEREEDTCKALAEQAGEKPAETLACPGCGSALVLQNGKLVEYVAPKFDPTAAERLKEHSAALVTLRNTVANREKDLAASVQAVEALNNQEPVDFDPKELAAKEQEISKAREMMNELAVELEELRELQHKAESADKKAAQATAHHQSVLAWLDLAEAFSPEGIPGEIVATALSPINNRLAQSAADTGWMTPRIDAEMRITANGRRYGSLSESEKWRCDAMLAEAISFVSDTKLLLLDGFDVIEVESRGSLMSWLTTLGEYGDVDTLICCGTLKRCPAGNEWVETHWVEAGEIVGQQKAEAA